MKADPLTWTSGEVELYFGLIRLNQIGICVYFWYKLASY